MAAATPPRCATRAKQHAAVALSRHVLAAVVMRAIWLQVEGPSDAGRGVSITCESARCCLGGQLATETIAFIARVW